MLKQSTLFVSPLSAQQCFKPPPSLFLVFMITKITTRWISWESERLWATLQEWHCSSVCKFLRGKLYVAVRTVLQCNQVPFHNTYPCYTQPVIFHRMLCTSLIAVLMIKLIMPLVQNTKCILKLWKTAHLTQNKSLLKEKTIRQLIIAKLNTHYN